MKKWLYSRDFKNRDELYIIASYWIELGYRVFVQGYSACEVLEICPSKTRRLVGG